jgi:hypothetical protein
MRYTRQQDNRNLREFMVTVHKAYAQAKSQGRISTELAGKVENATAKDKIKARREFRRGVFNKYHTSIGGLTDRIKAWSLDWEKIYTWIQENISWIIKWAIKIGVAIVPFMF